MGVKIIGGVSLESCYARGIYFHSSGTFQIVNVSGAYSGILTLLDFIRSSSKIDLIVSQKLKLMGTVPRVSPAKPYTSYSNYNLKNNLVLCPIWF